MEGKVVVYVIRDRHHEDRRHAVQKLFRTKDFTVLIPDIPYDSIDSDTTNPYERQEAYQLGWCLSDAKEFYPKQPVLILKDSSLCVADNNTVYNAIYGVLNNDTPFHVCYLCKWNDQCHLHSHRKQLKGTAMYVAKTQSPHGVQALLFSVNGRDTLLGLKPMKNGDFFKARESLGKTLQAHIVHSNLDALCVMPNLITYDIRLAQKDDDFVKVNECTSVLHFGSSSPNAINIYVAALIIIILLFLIIWAAICVAP